MEQPLTPLAAPDGRTRRFKDAPGGALADAPVRWRQWRSCRCSRSSHQMICDLSRGVGKAAHDCYYSRRSDSLRKRRLPATSTLLLLRFRDRGPLSANATASPCRTAGGSPRTSGIPSAVMKAPMATAANRPTSESNDRKQSWKAQSYPSSFVQAKPQPARRSQWRQANSDQRPQGLALAAHIPANPTSWIGSNPSASRKVEIVPSR
jgi:hypothetical protein